MGVDEARQGRRVGIVRTSRAWAGRGTRRVGPDGDDPAVLDQEGLMPAAAGEPVPSMRWPTASLMVSTARSLGSSAEQKAAAQRVALVDEER